MTHWTKDDLQEHMVRRENWYRKPPASNPADLTDKEVADVTPKSDLEVYLITPTPKPRMTRRDKWLKPARPCVARYWAFCDEVRLNKIELPSAHGKIRFVLPMPKSWSETKKNKMYWKPHKQKPDLSNLLKALEDAIFQDDSHIWRYDLLEKVWGDKGQVWVKNKNSP